MDKAYYETFKEISSSGINLSYHTAPGGYHPLHWHEELEILYALNGDIDIIVNNQNYPLPRKQLIVIESCQVHSSYTHHTASMFLCIHISKKQMQQYLPDIELYRIHCYPQEICDEEFPLYLEICRMLETLTRLYIENAPVFEMEAKGIVLQVLAHLLRHFSTREAPSLGTTDVMTMERIRQVITYVNEHFRDPISLLAISDHLGLSREYFCRFFKQNMGISFLNYLSEVRLTHIYQDLLTTDTPIAELAEQNGFTNQKLFNKSFRQLYGCTPSSVRKSHSPEQGD